MKMIASALLVAVVSALVYAQALGFGFWFDDPIPNLTTVESHSALELLLPVSGFGYYRPLGLLLLWSLVRLFGGYVPALHAVPLALHSTNAVLLWLLARRRSNSEVLAWVAALAFALFPFGTEAIAYFGAFWHPLVLFWTLLFLFAADMALEQGRRLPVIASYLCLSMSLLSHESGVTAAVVVLLWQLTQSRRKVTRLLRAPLEGYAAITTVYLIVYAIASPGGASGIALEGLADKALAVCQTLVYPILLVCRIPASQPHLLVCVALGFVAISGLLVWRTRYRSTWAFGMLFFAVAYAPSFLLLERDYFIHGPRLTYLPAAGLCLAWGACLAVLLTVHVGPLAARVLSRGAGCALCIALVLLPYPFIQGQLRGYALTSRVVEEITRAAKATPLDEELVFVNLPYYWNADSVLGGRASPYPWLRWIYLVIPKYSSAELVIDANGGPRRPVTEVYCAGYEPDWVTTGEQVSATRLRSLAERAQVYVLDLPAATLYDLTAAWSASLKGLPPESPAFERFLTPLRSPPELALSGEIERAQRIQRSFGGLLRLEAAAMEPEEALPGEVVQANLYWRAEGEAREILGMQVRLGDRFGNLLFEEHSWPVPGLPTTMWPQGEMYVSRLRLPIPANASYGLAAMGVEVFVEAKEGDQPASLGEEQMTFLIGKNSLVRAEGFIPPRLRQETLGPIRLVGHEPLPQEVDPSENLTVVLYWRAEAPTDVDYTVFRQLVSGSGEVVAQRDSEPNDGLYPTSAWPVGALVSDEQVIETPEGLAPGRYSLLVGLYTWPSMERVSVVVEGRDAGDAVVLGEVIVQ